MKIKFVIQLQLKSEYFTYDICCHHKNVEKIINSRHICVHKEKITKYFSRAHFDLFIYSDKLIHDI